MKEQDLTERDLFYSRWTPDLKKKAGNWYQNLRASQRELVDKVLSPDDQWLVEDYLGVDSEKLPSQKEMSRRIGYSVQRGINIGTRLALLKLMRVSEGGWPPTRERIEVPEIMVEGPGIGRDGRRTGEIYIAEPVGGKGWEEVMRDE